MITLYVYFLTLLFSRHEEGEVRLHYQHIQAQILTKPDDA